MHAPAEDATPDERSSRPQSLAEYERAARARMSPAALGYVEGGAGDEVTLADNVAAWRRWALRPRMLAGARPIEPGARPRGVRGGGTRIDPGVTVLGVGRPHPIVVAPTAFQRLVHPDGEAATAR